MEFERLVHLVCIQDTLSSRAALGLPAAAFRPSASREQRYLAYKHLVLMELLMDKVWIMPKMH